MKGFGPFGTFDENQSVFLLHLDGMTSVRLRRESDNTYTVIGTERVGRTEHEQMHQGGLTLADACIWLGVVIGMHAGDYQATHGGPPPYLAPLQQKLRAQTN